jgi:hypothetical protein
LPTFAFCVVAAIKISKQTRVLIVATTQKEIILNQVSKNNCHFYALVDLLTFE